MQGSGADERDTATNGIAGEAVAGRDRWDGVEGLGRREREGLGEEGLEVGDDARLVGNASSAEGTIEAGGSVARGDWAVGELIEMRDEAGAAEVDEVVGRA